MSIAKHVEVFIILTASLLLSSCCQTGLKSARDYYNYSSAFTYLSRGAFCLSEPNLHYFPSELPEESLPWIWDAVYEQSSRRIFITTIPRKNCLLEFNIVEQFLQSFPQYGISYITTDTKKHTCKCIQYVFLFIHDS